jgi:hypothetical protein
VFAGGREGYFYALAAVTRAVLWKVMTGASVARPLSYMLPQIVARELVATSTAASR